MPRSAGHAGGAERLSRFGLRRCRFPAVAAAPGFFLETRRARSSTLRRSAFMLRESNRKDCAVRRSAAPVSRSVRLCGSSIGREHEHANDRFRRDRPPCALICPQGCIGRASTCDDGESIAPQLTMPMIRAGSDTPWRASEPARIGTPGLHGARDRDCPSVRRGSGGPALAQGVRPPTCLGIARGEERRGEPRECRCHGSGLESGPR